MAVAVYGCPHLYRTERACNGCLIQPPEIELPERCTGSHVLQPTLGNCAGRITQRWCSRFTACSVLSPPEQGHTARAHNSDLDERNCTLRLVLVKMTAWVMVSVSYRSHRVSNFHSSRSTATKNCLMPCPQQLCRPCAHSNGPCGRLQGGTRAAVLPNKLSQPLV